MNINQNLNYSSVSREELEISRSRNRASSHVANSNPLKIIAIMFVSIAIVFLALRIKGDILPVLSGGQGVSAIFYSLSNLDDANITLTSFVASNTYRLDKIVVALDSCFNTVKCD